MSLISSLFGKKVDYIKKDLNNEFLHEEISLLLEMEKNSNLKLNLLKEIKNEWIHWHSNSSKKLKEHFNTVKETAKNDKKIIERFQQRIKENDAELINALHFAKSTNEQKESSEVHAELMKLQNFLSFDANAIKKQNNFFKNTKKNPVIQHKKIAELLYSVHEENKILHGEHEELALLKQHADFYNQSIRMKAMKIKTLEKYGFNFHTCKVRLTLFLMQNWELTKRLIKNDKEGYTRNRIITALSACHVYIEPFIYEHFPEFVALSDYTKAGTGEVFHQFEEYSYLIKEIGWDEYYAGWIRLAKETEEKKSLFGYSNYFLWIFSNDGIFQHSPELLIKIIGWTQFTSDIMNILTKTFEMSHYLPNWFEKMSKESWPLIRFLFLHTGDTQLKKMFSYNYVYLENSAKEIGWAPMLQFAQRIWERFKDEKVLDIAVVNGINTIRKNIIIKDFNRVFLDAELFLTSTDDFFTSPDWVKSEHYEIIDATSWEYIVKLKKSIKWESKALFQTLSYYSLILDGEKNWNVVTIALIDLYNKCPSGKQREFFDKSIPEQLLKLDYPNKTNYSCKSIFKFRDMLNFFFLWVSGKIDDKHIQTLLKFAITQSDDAITARNKIIHDYTSFNDVLAELVESLTPEQAEPFLNEYIDEYQESIRSIDDLKNIGTILIQLYSQGTGVDTTDLVIKYGLPSVNQIWENEKKKDKLHAKIKIVFDELIILTSSVKDKHIQPLLIVDLKGAHFLIKSLEDLQDCGKVFTEFRNKTKYSVDIINTIVKQALDKTENIIKNENDLKAILSSYEEILKKVNEDNKICGVLGIGLKSVKQLWENEKDQGKRYSKIKEILQELVNLANPLNASQMNALFNNDFEKANAQITSLKKLQEYGKVFAEFRKQSGSATDTITLIINDARNRACEIIKNENDLSKILETYDEILLSKNKDEEVKFILNQWLPQQGDEFPNLHYLDFRISFLISVEIYRKTSNLRGYIQQNKKLTELRDLFIKRIHKMHEHVPSDKEIKKIITYEKIRMLCSKEFFKDTFNDEELKELLGTLDMRVLTTKFPEDVTRLVKSAKELGNNRYMKWYITQNLTALKNLKKHGIKLNVWLGNKQLHLIKRLVSEEVQDVSPEEYKKQAVEAQLGNFKSALNQLFSNELIPNKEEQNNLFEDIKAKAANIMSISKKEFSNTEDIIDKCAEKPEQTPNIINKAILTVISNENRMSKIINPEKKDSFNGARGELDQIAASIDKIIKGKTEKGRMLNLSFNVSKKFPLDLKIKTKWRIGGSHFFQPSVLTIGNDGGCCVAMNGVNEFAGYNFFLDSDALLINIMDEKGNKQKRVGMILAFAALENNKPILALNTVETPFRSDPKIYPKFCDLCMQMLGAFAHVAGFEKIVMGTGYGSSYFQEAYPKVEIDMKKMNPFKPRKEERYYTNAFEGGGSKETPEGIVLSYKKKGHLIWTEKEGIERNKLAQASIKYNQEWKPAA